MNYYELNANFQSGAFSAMFVYLLVALAVPRPPLKPRRRLHLQLLRSAARELP